jgi:hypothetical protein
MDRDYTGGTGQATLHTVFAPRKKISRIVNENGTRNYLQ